MKKYKEIFRHGGKIVYCYITFQNKTIEFQIGSKYFDFQLYFGKDIAVSFHLYKGHRQNKENHLYKFVKIFKESKK